MALNNKLQKESVQVLNNIIEAAQQQSRLIDLLLENVGRQQSQLQNMVITVKGIPAAMQYTDENAFPFTKTPALLMYQERSKRPKDPAPPPPLPAAPPVGPGSLPPRPSEEELKAIRKKELAWAAHYKQEEMKRVDVNNPVRKPVNAEDRDHAKLILALTSPEGRLAPVLESFRTKERAWVSCYEVKPDPKQEDRYKRALALDHEYYFTRKIDWGARYARKLDSLPLPNVYADDAYPVYRKDYVTRIILKHMVDCLNKDYLEEAAAAAAACLEEAEDPTSGTTTTDDPNKEGDDEAAVYKRMEELTI